MAMSTFLSEVKNQPGIHEWLPNLIEPTLDFETLLQTIKAQEDTNDKGKTDAEDANKKNVAQKPPPQSSELEIQKKIVAKAPPNAKTNAGKVDKNDVAQKLPPSPTESGVAQKPPPQSSELESTKKKLQKHRQKLLVIKGRLTKIMLHKNHHPNHLSLNLP